MNDVDKRSTVKTLNIITTVTLYILLTSIVIFVIR